MGSVVVRGGAIGQSGSSVRGCARSCGKLMMCLAAAAAAQAKDGAKKGAATWPVFFKANEEN